MEWTSRYEALRQQILQPAGESFSAGHGLTVLLQRGMTAWMRVWSDCAPLPRTTSSLPGSATADPLLPFLTCPTSGHVCWSTCCSITLRRSTHEPGTQHSENHR
jgi:hypothetical protein